MVLTFPLLQDLSEDLSAVHSRWLSSGNQPSPGGPNPNTVNPNPSSVRTPDVEAMDMDTYAKNLHLMNDSLHDLQSDIQRLAAQQTQIQQMMSPQRQQQQQPPQQQQHNPMDPQPFYMASDHPPMGGPGPGPGPMTPQRRTWGQPQPINFAHQQQPHPDMHGGPAGWQSPRRQQWGQR